MFKGVTDFLVNKQHSQLTNSFIDILLIYPYKDNTFTVLDKIYTIPFFITHYDIHSPCAVEHIERQFVFYCDITQNLGSFSNRD